MVVDQRISPFVQEDILKSLISTDTKSQSVHGYSNANRKNNVGKNLRSAILRADLESRLVIGLSAAVQQLSVEASDTLFCVLVSPKKGDSATHMQEVLLKAFCFENDIYIIQVDSAQKLSRLLNVSPVDSCVLLQRSRAAQGENSATEELLIDFCEEHWNAPDQPVVQLPEA